MKTGSAFIFLTPNNATNITSGNDANDKSDLMLKKRTSNEMFKTTSKVEMETPVKHSKLSLVYGSNENSNNSKGIKLY